MVTNKTMKCLRAKYYNFLFLIEFEIRNDWIESKWVNSSIWMLTCPADQLNEIKS